MRRKPFIFTCDELKTLHSLLTQHECTNTELIKKFELSETELERTLYKVLLSYDEVETLLDCLPIPISHESTVLTAIRDRLTSFTSL